MLKCHVQAPEGAAFEVELPNSVLSRSPILQDTFSLGSEVPMLTVPFGMDFFDVWMQHGSMPCAELSTESAAKGILAADFFADDTAVQQFATLLSLKMFPLQACTCPGPSRPLKQRRVKRSSHAAASCCNNASVSDTRSLNEKILRQLSTGLITSILRKAEVSLATCLQYLPSCLHHIAISAKCCGAGPSASTLTLSSHHASSLSNLSTATTSRRKRAQACEVPAAHFHCEVLTAAASLTHTTSLTLSSSFLAGLEDNSSLRKSFCNLLLSLTALRELMISDGASTACLDSLVSALPQMPSCSALCISIPHPRMTSRPPFCTKWSHPIRGIPGYQDSIHDPNTEHNYKVYSSHHDFDCAAVPKPENSSLNALLKQLRVLPQLQRLEFAGTKRDCQDVLAFCAALKHLTGLTALNITHCFTHRGSVAIGDGLKVTKRLGDALRKLKLLQHLNLQGSFPGDIIDPVLDSIATLTRLTHLNLKSLRCMSVTTSPLPMLALSKGTGFGFRLAPMLRALKKLQYLNLSECFIPTGTMEDVVSSICRLSCLTQLELQQVSREQCFWELFTAHVSSLQRLQRLIICMNPCINNSTVGPLTKALAHLPDLQVLDTHFCRIGLDGAAAMCQHLPRLTSLKALDIQCNRILPQGTQHLADCIKLMPNLQEVTLLDTDIQDLGEQVIIGALEESRGLDWGNQMRLTVLEDSADLRRMYFSAGYKWFGRYWKAVQAGAQIGVPGVQADQVFLVLLMMVGGA